MDKNFDEGFECDDCQVPIEDTNWSGMCQDCKNEDARRNPHPLDIAEAEFQQDQCPNLNDFSSQFYPEGY